MLDESGEEERLNDFDEFFGEGEKAVGGETPPVKASQGADEARISRMSGRGKERGKEEG